jgi:two-component system, chemotaxis family, sensor kinase CheA
MKQAERMSEFWDEGFIQEFFEEARDHLSSVHEHLLILEQSVTKTGEAERGYPRQDAVEHLFRSFHTLKGLAGMIGLEAAAHLSHHMESILRGIQKVEIEVTDEIIQALFMGVEKLEAVIATLGNTSEIVPDVEDEIAMLAGLLSSPDTQKINATPPVTEAAAASVPIDHYLSDIFTAYPEIRASITENDYPALLDAILKGRYLLLGTFIPNSEWSAKGVNVGLIRQQLSSAGTLIKSIPLTSGPMVRFAFLMAAEAPIDQGQFPFLEWITLLLGRQIIEVEQESEQILPSAVLPETLGKVLQTNLVRVHMTRLDDLVQLVGELVVLRGALSDQVAELTGTAPAVRRQLTQTMGSMDRSLRRLRDAILRTRMVPLGEVFNHMPLAVRDLVRSTGKDVQLVIEGADTEIDKVLVDRLFDPLLHLVRNAIIHGIETAEQRSAAGKPGRGRLTLRGKPEGDHILIEVSDDGRGIESEKVVRQALAMGIMVEGEELSENEILDLLCRPGFSTWETPDLGAGRGIGMDVVRRMVTTMNGTISLNTKPGLGTTFTLRMPLSLVILNAVIVQCQEEIYAIPQALIEEVIQIDPDEVKQAESGEYLSFRNQALVIYRLDRLFHLPVLDRQSKKPYCYGLIVGQGDRQTALMVERLIGLREVVVRPINDPLITSPGVTGATELGNGRVILILNPSDLVAEAKRKPV